MRSSVFAFQEFQIVRHIRSGLYMMRIDHFNPGTCQRFYEPEEKAKLFINPWQWKNEKDDTEVEDIVAEMSRQADERIQQFADAGSMNPTFEYVAMLNQKNKGTEAESADEDWAAMMNAEKEKYKRGELDLSDYAMAKDEAESTNCLLYTSPSPRDS